MKMTKTGVKKFILYVIRWELSSIILAPCLIWFGGLGEWPATIIANGIGACIFFLIDKKIFKEDDGKKGN